MKTITHFGDSFDNEDDDDLEGFWGNIFKKVKPKTSPWGTKPAKKITGFKKIAYLAKKAAKENAEKSGGWMKKPIMLTKPLQMKMAVATSKAASKGPGELGQFLIALRKFLDGYIAKS